MEKSDNEKQLFFTLDDIRTKVFSGKISKSTLINMIKAKQLPVITMMKRNFVPRWWVEEQIKKATIKPSDKETER